MEDNNRFQIIWGITMLTLLGLSMVVYLLPVWIAVLRTHPQTIGIMVVTILTGWTVLGWIAALIWSFISPQKPLVLPPPLPSGPLLQLNQLASLRDRSAISPEEYEAQKRKILA
jgi:hypothetical protein